ncbi:uncharacterized protein tex15 [Mobula birostris]|uniref:uncharacterized protein tex15 n=1 Tax=Mobula birostris TaxID=1983395 RepID=UPI003B287565
MESKSKNKIQHINTNSDSLKKFTIPRKRTTDSAYLEICRTDWREYSFIQSTLEGSKLDSSNQLNLLWNFGDVKLIHNVKIEQRFAAKRSEMRQEGRRGKEMEEITFFFVTSQKSALKLYQDGLSINSSDINALGNPAYGVYLHRHIDVLLNYHKRNNLAAETVLFFKVLLGRVRTIPPRKVTDKTDIKPTAKFDCHISQIPASLKDPIDIQAINSAVYLYEFNELYETMEYPRHCLPYALVTVKFMGQDMKSAEVPYRHRFAALPELPRLKSCTVAKRLGKGKNAKVVYKKVFEKMNPPASPSNSFGNIVTSCASQDPRLVKRGSYVESGKKHLFPETISLSAKQLKDINTLIRTICFLNAYSSLLPQQRYVNEAEQPVLNRAEEDEAQSHDLKNGAEDRKNLEPLEMSVLVMTSASGGSQSTTDSAAITSEANICHEFKPVEKENALSSLTELDMKKDSDTQKSTFPSRLNATELSGQPYFEDLNLYESEVKKKLRKYSAFLVLPDKERLSRINSLQMLNQGDKWTFYCRLKLYEKYYERYRNELGLCACSNAVPSKANDSHSLCNSDGSSAQDAKPGSCALSHLDISCGCSTDLVTACRLSESKGLGQSAITLPDVKVKEKQSVGGPQTIMTATDHVLHDGNELGCGLLYNTEAVITEQSGAEDIPGMSHVADVLQRSVDSGKTRVTQDVSAITICQPQASSPSVACNYGGDEQFSFLSDIHHPDDGSITNVEISDSCETADISKVKVNIGISDKSRMIGQIQSSLENGGTGNTEERSVPDTHLKEVQTLVTSVKYIEKAYGKSSNTDPLLIFLGARIDWEKLFETSREDELQINVDSGTATKMDNDEQHVPLPSVTEASQLVPHCSEAPGGEDNKIQSNSVPISESLPVLSSQIAIASLQMTLSSGLNALSDSHPDLTGLTDHIANHPGISEASHRLMRTISERQSESCLKTAEKACNMVFHGLLSKPVSMLVNLGFRETSQTDIKELSTEGEACDLISKNGLHCSSNKTTLSCPDPQITKNCRQTNLFCASPRDIQPSMSGHEGSPNNCDCNMATKCVEKLADIQSEMAEVKSSSDSHDTKRIHIGSHTKSKRDNPRLADSLSEESVLRKKSRKMSASKPHGKDVEKLNHHSKKQHNLKKNSKVTSKCGIALNFKHMSQELCMSRKSTDKDNGVSVQQEIASPTDREHKPIKEDNQGQFSDKTKGISYCDKNVKTLRENNHLESKAVALLQPKWSTKSMSQVHMSCTDDDKRDFRGAGSSTDNLYSLYNDRVHAFNSCQKKIAHAVSVLSSEASFSKSSRLSKLLSRAVRDLNKAFKKVDKSSEIVRRIGMNLNQNLLPKSYQTNCNNFWECYDMYFRRHRKEHRKRFIWKTETRDNGVTSEEQPKSLVSELKQLCKRRLCAKGRKSEWTATSNVKPASIASLVVNPRVCLKCMQNIHYPWTIVTLNNHVQITQQRLSHRVLHKSKKMHLPSDLCVQTAQTGAGSTSADPQDDCCLMSAEEMGVSTDPKPLESSTTSTLAKSQIKLDVDSKEGRMYVWGNTDLVTVLEFPFGSPVVEVCFDSQMGKRLNKPQELEVPSETQSLKHLNSRHPIKSSELTKTRSNLQPQSEYESRTTLGKNQGAYCKSSGSELNSPCGCQNLDCLLPIKMPKSSAEFDASQHLLHPQPVEFQTRSFEKPFLVDAVPQCFKAKFPVIPISTGSKLPYLTDSQQTRENSYIVASDMEPETAKPRVKLNTTELQAGTPHSNSQFEFNMTSQVAGSWIDPIITGNGAEMGCPTAVQVGKSPAAYQAEQCTNDLQMVETQTEPGAVVLQEGPSMVKFQNDSFVRLRNEDLTEMKEEEGETASENGCGVVKIRMPGISHKAGRAEAQSWGHKIRHSPNTKETQQAGVLVAKISEILYQADSTSLLESLEKLKVKCERMLPAFILAFEQSQGVSFAETVICRNWLLRNGLHSAASVVCLKPSALEPYVELQMMMETVWFLKNKISFLRGGLTLRSLLWYDETLFGELLTKKMGYQQQSSLYPSFQERIASGCLQALSDYQTQILKSCLTETMRQNAYYVYLKHRRELDECSSVKQNLSDCSCFCLSVPITCSINYGASLGDLSTLHKNVRALISRLASLPKGQHDMAKLLHLWVIVDFVKGKTRYIHENLVPNEELRWFGLEHLQFNVAKTLVWQMRGERKLRGGNKDWSQTGNTTKRVSELNREALDLYNSYSNIGRIPLNGKEQMGVTQVADKLPRTLGTISFHSVEDILPEHPEYGLNDCLQSCFQLPSEQFDSVGRILEHSRGAQQAELDQLLVKCECHVESLKKLFQVLQEVETENALVTEANVFDPFAAQDTSPILLNSKATEIYIELLMMFETAQYLKNLIAHRASRPTYRGMLWFDSSLLPELLHIQQYNSNFSNCRKEYLQDLSDELERAISRLEQEVDLIFEYRESSNYAYAVQVMSRQLSEVIAIRDYIYQHNLSVSEYANMVPHTATINYGNTESDLDHNYRQLAALLEKLIRAPVKDFGKMAHITVVLKSIADMRQVAAERTSSTLHILTYQMQFNSKKRRLLEDVEMVLNSHKLRNPLDQPDTVQRGTPVTVTPGYKHLSGAFAGKRKRQRSKSPLVPNRGELGVDSAPKEV